MSDQRPIPAYRPALDDEGFDPAVYGLAPGTAFPHACARCGKPLDDTAMVSAVGWPPMHFYCWSARDLGVPNQPHPSGKSEEPGRTAPDICPPSPEASQ